MLSAQPKASARRQRSKPSTLTTATLKTFADVLEDFGNELDDVDSQDELLALLENPDAIDSAADDFQAACEAVERAATDNGATLNLDCGGDEDDS